MDYMMAAGFPVRSVTSSKRTKKGYRVMNSNKDEVIYSYLDSVGMKRKWIGYRFLYEAIVIFLNDQSLDCNQICTIISKSDQYKEYTPRTVYTSAMYAIKNSNLSGSTPYRFICDAAIDLNGKI